MKIKGIWVQDFLLKNSSTKKADELGSDFFDTLSDYVSHLSLDNAFLTNYDFSNVRIVLVTSIPG